MHREASTRTELEEYANAWSQRKRLRISSLCSATPFSHELMLSTSITESLSAAVSAAEAEREAEKEVRRLTLLSTGRDAAGQVPIGEWEAMTWVERLARLKSAAPSEGSF